MVDTGESVMLRAPNGNRHLISVSDEGVIATTTGTVYNEIVLVGVGGLSTGVPLTLPSSETYLGDELEVKLGSTVLSVGTDYEYVGTGIKTQVAFTFDLVEDDEINFKKIV